MKLFLSFLLAFALLTLSLPQASAQQAKKASNAARISSNADPIDFKTEAGRQRFWQQQADRRGGR